MLRGDTFTAVPVAALLRPTLLRPTLLRPLVCACAAGAETLAGAECDIDFRADVLDPGGG